MQQWSVRSDTASEAPLDPLQRRAELIEHYETHSAPERAAYLRRIDNGPAVIGAYATAIAQPTNLAAVERAATELSDWWVGPADDHTPAATIARILNPMTLQEQPLDSFDQGYLDDGIVAGLAARADTRLQPWPPELNGIAPSMLCYQLLISLRVKLGSSGQLPKWPLPPPHREASEVHMIVCELCTFVITATRYATRCPLCRNRHGKPEALLTSRASGWVVTGYLQKTLRTCDHCGRRFIANGDAITCSAKCRVARHRA